MQRGIHATIIEICFSYIMSMNAQHPSEGNRKSWFGCNHLGCNQTLIQTHKLRT